MRNILPVWTVSYNLLRSLFISLLYLYINLGSDSCTKWEGKELVNGYVYLEWERKKISGSELFLMLWGLYLSSLHHSFIHLRSLSFPFLLVIRSVSQVITSISFTSQGPSTSGNKNRNYSYPCFLASDG